MTTPGLIEPREAVKIFEVSSTLDELQRTRELYTECKKSPFFNTGESYFDTIMIMSFMYQTGRIQGIREERTRKRGQNK